MVKQIYYEDVQEGAEIPTLEKLPTTTTLVMYAGASGDFNPLHYDKDFATKLGFPSVLVHGRLGAAFLSQLLTDWIGDQGEVKKLSVQYRGNAFPGDKFVCKGKVTKKYVEGDKHLIECEIWAENPKGDRITPGTAVVALPSKGKKK
ncbi:MAG TPA: MaoC/PaaZ C-terminal domain-containing protein [Dehalococcoidia bacterium]|nr:MaoC/PaaZ C-terminal domain-containing protein [Dehalococcoidia bacterium]